MRHILTAKQFSRSEVEGICEATERLRMMPPPRLGRYLLFNLFFEPSTRTRLSFAAAAHHLGLSVLNVEHARLFASVVKGESLEDTIKVLCSYAPDVIVLRYHEAGGAARAAHVSTVPIINAGDGDCEHPTQALADIYTIQQALGSIHGLTITIGGDLLHNRSARSLAYLLALFQGVTIRFVGPPWSRMAPSVVDYLAHAGVLVVQTAAMDLTTSNVVYWTQTERGSIAPLGYTIGLKEVATMRADAILMHPLPRLGEISTDVDGQPQARYFQQAGNGLLVRMALLTEILQED